MSGAQINFLDEIIVDNFAGGGGASTGIELATGRVVDIAVNHDPDAILMHKTNHPHTRHFQASVWDVDPVEVCQGRPVGLAWFSPDCKHFSKAKGGKPVDKNIRGLAWIVLRWAGTVRPRVIILENVEEFQTWGPVRKGKPVKKLVGQTFHKWMEQLKNLGYAVEWRELVAADYGAPTTRKRFFLIARHDGRPIVWPKPTHAPADSPEVKSGKKKPWRSAAEIIDWSLPCPSILTAAQRSRKIWAFGAAPPPSQYYAACGQRRGQVRDKIGGSVSGDCQPCWGFPRARNEGAASNCDSKTRVRRGLPCHGAADGNEYHQQRGGSRGRPSAYRDNRRKPNADYANPGRNRADRRRGPRAQRNGADAHPGVKSGGVRGVSDHDPVPHGAIGASERPKRQRTGYDH